MSSNEKDSLFSIEEYLQYNKYIFLNKKPQDGSEENPYVIIIDQNTGFEESLYEYKKNTCIITIHEDCHK